MQAFDYFNPTRIVFGAEQIARLTELVPANARVLVLYGGGSIKQNGTYSDVMAALKQHTVFEFGGIEANPTFETLMRAVEQVKAENIDFLLAVGGGSVIDGTKFVAAAACYDGDPWEILTTFGAKVRAAVPLACVLTLPATGSEMNSGSVVSRQSTQEKLFFHSPTVFPQFAILDPTKTYSLPPRQVANGVVDAFVHVMEQYLTYPADGLVQDRFAEGLLKTLIEVGPQALANPMNYEVRANLMWAATMALNGLIGAGVPQDWATHMLGHEITALYGLDHAQTLAIILPAMLWVRRDSKRAKLLQYGERVWGMLGSEQDEHLRSIVEQTRAFFASLGVKTRLSDYGLGDEAIDAILARLAQHGMTALGEQRDVTLEVSRQVLLAAR